MTPEEQQQVNAMMRFYEQQIANLSREGAQAAGVSEVFAIKLKAAEKELGELKKKYDGTDKVVPIKEPA